MVFTELLYFIWVSLCHAQRFPLTWKENILCPLIFFRKGRPALNPMVDQFGLFYYFFWWVIQVCNILSLHNLKFIFKVLKYYCYYCNLWCLGGWGERKEKKIEIHFLSSKYHYHFSCWDAMYCFYRSIHWCTLWWAVDCVCRICSRAQRKACRGTLTNWWE